MNAPLLASLVLLATPLLAQGRVFRVDPNHTVFGFRAATPLFDVPGRFTRFKADIQGDPAAPAGARVRIELDAASVDTAIRARDEHLRSADFFDAKRYPKITFVADEVCQAGDKLQVRGTLNLRGVSRELELAFDPAEGENGAGVHTWSYRASLPLDRLDYGLGADSVAAKISLKRQVELNLLLVGFFEDAAKPAVKPKKK